jgi:uncharacterized cupin superfamily protein
MLNNTIVNILSPSDIAEILNSAAVSANKEKLATQHKVDFSIELSESIKTKLGSALGLDLSQSATIPMRWIKGNTPAHKDKGKEEFSTTYLVYLTNSVGQLIVDGQTYAIAAGDAHIFSEGLEHSTMNTENSERLMIGPMSEAGFQVGGFGVSFTMNTVGDPAGPQGFTYRYLGSGNGEITIFGFPPTIPSSSGDYTVEEFGPFNWVPPAGKTFGGWKLMVIPEDIGINYPLVNPPTSGIYMPGETYEFDNLTALVPNWIDAPIADICFAASTPIETDQGVMPIEKVNPDTHTINNKKVVAITKTVTLDNYLVCFEKDALGDNVPSERTVVSKEHLIYNKGKMIKAKDFIGKYKNVHKIKYNGDILYNVLLEKYDKILVNNLICETLHPRNALAKFYTSLSQISAEDQSRIVKMHNDKATNSHNWTLKCKRIKNNIKMKR